MMFNVVYALGELAVMYPVSGGFYTYSTRFVDPSWGFAMGWNYVFQWAVVLPLELTVAAITVEYWGAGVNVAVWITGEQQSCVTLVIESNLSQSSYSASFSSTSSAFWVSRKKSSGPPF